MDGAISIRDDRTRGSAARIGEAITFGTVGIVYGDRGIWITSSRFAARVFESFVAVSLLPAPVFSSTCSPACSAEW